MGRILLNIGCGSKKIPGFINLDREPGADIRADVTDGLPFANNSVDGIFSEHFIEHLSQAEGLAFLRECRRVLAPHGILRIATPDLDYLAERYADNWRDQAWFKEFGYEWVANRCEMLNISMREWGHQWLYNEEELVRLASYAGLSLRARCAFGQSDEPALRGLEYRRESRLIVEFCKDHPDDDGEPLVSVLLAAYNPRYFRACLESALRQTYAHIEIVICDDCPTNEVGQIVAEYSTSDRRIRYVTNDPPLGAYQNYLRCFSLAAGQYIKFLNDDDLLHPSCVERLVRCLRQLPDVTLATSHRQRIDAEGNALPDIPATRRPVRQDSLIDGVSLAAALLTTAVNFVGEPTTVMFRKRDLDDARPHILSFANRPVAWNVDVAMWLHLLSKGDAIYLVDTLSYFRQHREQQQAGPDALREGNAAWQQLKCDGQRMGLWNPGQPRSLVTHPVELRPKWPEAALAHVRQAEIQISQGEFIAAGEALSQAVALVPDDPDLTIALGNVRLQLGEVEAARREFLKATVLHPQYAPAHAHLAAVSLHLGRGAEAETSACQALALEPANPTALKVLARVCLDSERYAEAVRAYVAVLRTNPDDLETLLVVGNCYAEAGRLEEANTFYQRVLRLDPGNTAAAASLAVLSGKAPSSDRPVSIESEATTREPVGVSIIIPVFNRLDLTRQCLESIGRNSPGGRYEIIVVDNGSTDGTTEFLRQQQVGWLRAILNAENMGYARACNQGASAAAGQYLLFLNNDTEVKPGWLEPLLTVLDADPIVAAVGSKLLFPNGTIQHAGVIIVDDQKRLQGLSPCHIYYRLTASLPEANQARTYQALTAACLLVRQSAFEQVEGFDENYWNGFEDVDFCFKLQNLGWRLVYEPKSVVIHYESQSGPERFRGEWRNVERLRREWSGKVMPDFVIKPDGTCVKTGAGRVMAYSPPSPSSRGTAGTPTTRAEPIASIVIVTYNSAGTIRACLESVFSSTQAPIELIVVDNASTDATRAVLAEYQDRITALLNAENAGFSRGCNQGIRASAGQHVVLLNPDTVVTSGWLERLLSHVTSGVGAVGPVSDYVAGVQKFHFYLPAHRPATMTFPELADLLGGVNHGKAVETKLLIGFCMLVPRKVLDDVGLLDEDLFLGNDDLDLSWRLRLRGYRLLVATDAFVHHEGQVSFKSEAETKTSRLVQESTDRLYAKLEAHYGPGTVPSPMELWGIDWFKPTRAAIRPKPSTAGRWLTSIIILTHNGLEHTKKCLASIDLHTPEPHELIIVDNASSDGTLDYLRDYMTARDNVRVIANRSNRGFAAGNNQGLALARGDYLLLLNNDTIVTTGWLQRMLQVFEAHPDVGIVGPMSNYVSGPQLVRDASYKGPEGLEAFAAEWARGHDGQNAEATRVVGFCLLTCQEVIARIGGLDEQFGSGNFEDDDFCIRAFQVGFRARIALDVFIQHTGSQTFKGAKIDYRQSLMRNWGLFKAKWGIPADAPYEKGYRFPPQTAQGSDLSIRLPDLNADHRCEDQGRWWQETCGEPVEPIDKAMGQAQPAVTEEAPLSVVIVPNGHGLAPLWPSLVQQTDRPLAVTMVGSLSNGDGRDVEPHPACPESWRFAASDQDAVCQINQGLRSPGDGPVIMLSADLVLTPGWLKRLLAALDRDQRIAVIGPTLNHGLAPQRVRADYRGTGKALRQFAVRRAHRHARQLADASTVAPCCLVFKPSACRPIGPLREDLDLGASLCDYFTRLRHAGRTVAVALDAYVHREAATAEERMPPKDLATVKASEAARFGGEIIR